MGPSGRMLGNAFKVDLIILQKERKIKLFLNCVLDRIILRSLHTISELKKEKKRDGCATLHSSVHLASQ